MSDRPVVEEAQNHSRDAAAQLLISEYISLASAKQHFAQIPSGINAAEIQHQQDLKWYYEHEEWPWQTNRGTIHGPHPSWSEISHGKKQ